MKYSTCPIIITNPGTQIRVGYIATNGKKHTRMYTTEKEARDAWKKGERLKSLDRAFLKGCL